MGARPQTHKFSRDAMEHRLELGRAFAGEAPPPNAYAGGRERKWNSRTVLRVRKLQNLFKKSEFWIRKTDIQGNKYKDRVACFNLPMKRMKKVILLSSMSFRQRVVRH